MGKLLHLPQRKPTELPVPGKASDSPGDQLVNAVQAGVIKPGTLAHTVAQHQLTLEALVKDFQLMLSDVLGLDVRIAQLEQSRRQAVDLLQEIRHLAAQAAKGPAERQ